tara:strand:- start:305 stop:640 length:336 start_codon:yes stop_codon:yes gene_type:complete
MKSISIKADTTLKYLQIWNGIFNLTDKELEILSKLLDVYNKYHSTNSDNLCNSVTKKVIAEELKILDYRTLNNYVKRLKDKGAIIKNNNSYKINPLLNPTNDDIKINIKRN